MFLLQDISVPERRNVEEWLPVTSSRNAKWWYSAFHNVTAMVGAGVLSLPSAMAYLTWWESNLDPRTRLLAGSAPIAEDFLRKKQKKKHFLVSCWSSIKLLRSWWSFASLMIGLLRSWAADPCEDCMMGLTSSWVFVFLVLRRTGGQGSQCWCCLGSSHSSRFGNSCRCTKWRKFQASASIATTS